MKDEFKTWGEEITESVTEREVLEWQEGLEDRADYDRKMKHRARKFRATNGVVEDLRTYAALKAAQKPDPRK